MANKKLLAWNAQVILIYKIPNFLLTNKQKFTFNYQQIYKNLFGIHMKLSICVYNSFSNLCHKTLFLANLKYAYYFINLYLDDRLIFAFTIQDIV